MPRQEFFDIFGFLGFVFILIAPVWALATQRPLPKWTLTILVLIGIFGELVAEIYRTLWDYNHTRIHSALKMPPAVFAEKIAV